MKEDMLSRICETRGWLSETGRGRERVKHAAQSQAMAELDEVVGGEGVLGRQACARFLTWSATRPAFLVFVFQQVGVQCGCRGRE